LEFIEIIMKVEQSFDVNITYVNKRIYDFDMVKNLIDWLKTKVA
jgi:acyl carrier protein